MFRNSQRFKGGGICMLFLDVTKKCTLTTANQKRWTLMTANCML